MDSLRDSSVQFEELSQEPAALLGCRPFKLHLLYDVLDSGCSCRLIIEKLCRFSGDVKGDGNQFFLQDLVQFLFAYGSFQLVKRNVRSHDIIIEHTDFLRHTIDDGCCPLKTTRFQRTVFTSNIHAIRDGVRFPA